MKIVILEGPECPRLKGWRDYLIYYGGKTKTFLSQNWKAQRTAQIMHAKFFPAGTWEDQTITPLPNSFHTPRFEILAEMAGNPTQQNLNV